MRHPLVTFYVRVKRDSMIGAGIPPRAPPFVAAGRSTSATPDALEDAVGRLAQPTGDVLAFRRKQA